MRSRQNSKYPTSRFALKFASAVAPKIDMNTEAICDNNFGQGDTEPAKAKGAAPKKMRIPRVPHWLFLDEKAGAADLVMSIEMPVGFWRN